MAGGGGGGPSAEQRALERQQIKELNELKIREWKAKNAILRGRRGRASLIRNEGGEAGIGAGKRMKWTPRERPKVDMLPKPELIPLPEEKKKRSGAGRRGSPHETIMPDYDSNDGG